MLKAPLAKLKKNEKTVAFFLLLFTVMVFLSFSYIVPTFESNIITITTGVLGMFILLTFGIVT